MPGFLKCYGIHSTVLAVSYTWTVSGFYGFGGCEFRDCGVWDSGLQIALSAMMATCPFQQQYFIHPVCRSTEQHYPFTKLSLGRGPKPSKAKTVRQSQKGSGFRALGIEL